MIFITKVTILKDAMMMKNVRNDCAKFMTNDTRIISDDDQIKWWNELDKEKVIPYLMMYKQYPVSYVVGYGLINLFDNYCELTGCLYEGERGNGYGRRLFEFLTKEAKKIKDDVRLDVLSSNKVAHNLYKSLGYKEISRFNNIISMKLNGKI